MAVISELFIFSFQFLDSSLQLIVLFVCFGDGFTQHSVLSAQVLARFIHGSIIPERREWSGTSEKRCEWMAGKDEEVEMGERGRGRIKRDRGDYLLPLLNFNSLMTSGCFFNQMISSSSNSSSWFPYISPTPVRSQSRFTLKAEDMLLMSRFDGDIFPLSIKLISCFEHPTDDANFSMLRFFSFLT